MDDTMIYYTIYPIRGTFMLAYLKDDKHYAVSSKDHKTLEKIFRNSHRFVSLISLRDYRDLLRMTSSLRRTRAIKEIYGIRR